MIEEEVVQSPQIEAETPQSQKDNSRGGRWTRRSFIALSTIIGGGIAVKSKGHFLEKIYNFFNHERPSTNDFILETFKFPNGYAHDFILPPHPKLAAADGGASLKISKGMLVTLSDTLRGALQPRSSDGKQGILPGSADWINNMGILFNPDTQECTFITGPLQTVTDKDGEKRQVDTSWITPPQDKEERMLNVLEKLRSYYWIQNLVDQDGKVIISLARNKPNKKFNPHDPNSMEAQWVYIGTDIVRIDFSGPIPKQETITKLPRNLETASEETNWCASFLQDPQKKITYIFGVTEQKVSNPYHAKELRVARVPYGKVDDKSAWQFLSGEEWIPVAHASTEEQLDLNWKAAEQRATTILPNTLGLSNGFSTHLIDGKVVLMTQNSDGLGDGINVFLADSPEGPFQKHILIDKKQMATLIKDVNKPQNGRAKNYLAYLHPEAQDPEDKDRLLVTFCVFPESANPEEEMENNVHTYTRIAVWVDKKRVLNQV